LIRPRYLLGSDVREVYAKADVLIDPLFDKIDWDTALLTLTFEKGALGTIDMAARWYTDTIRSVW